MEDIKRICELTGSRYDEAERAYRDANGDFYLAVGNLQRSRKNSEGMGNNYNDMRGNRNMGMDRNAVQSGFTKFMESRLVFGKTRNCTLPLIFAAAIVLFGFEFAVPAAIIAFILGVRFTLTGPLFNKDIVIGLDRQPAGTAGYGNASYGSSSSYGGAYDGMVYGEDQAPSGGSFRQQYQQQERQYQQEQYQQAQYGSYQQAPRYGYQQNAQGAQAAQPGQAARYDSRYNAAGSNGSVAYEMPQYEETYDRNENGFF